MSVVQLQSYLRRTSPTAMNALTVVVTNSIERGVS